MTSITMPACLLIHGFTSSPREMKSLGDFLEAKGCLVRLPTLPGHDRQPAALFHARSEEWLRTVEREYERLAGRRSGTVVIGQSMGAALALHVAANYPVQGVITLAPALRLSLWRKLAVHLLSRVIKWQIKRNGPDVRDKSATSLLRSYDSFPTASVKELLKTMNFVRSELPRVTAPILILQGRHDRTMSAINVDILRQGVRSATIETVFLENSSHILTLDFDQQQVFATVLRFIQEHAGIGEAPLAEKQAP